MLQPREGEDGIYQFVLVQHYPDRDYNVNWFTIDVKKSKAFEENLADPENNIEFQLNKKDWNKIKKCVK